MPTPKTDAPQTTPQTAEPAPVPMPTTPVPTPTPQTALCPCGATFRLPDQSSTLQAHTRRYVTIDHPEDILVGPDGRLMAGPPVVRCARTGSPISPI